MEAAHPSGTGHSSSPADFFAGEVERLYAVPDGDVRLALGRVWQGFGVVTAGAELLARRGYPWHASLLHDMTPVLSEVSPALRGAASFPQDIGQVVVTADEAPGGEAGPALVYTVQRGVYEVALALTSLLGKTSRHAPRAADRLACRRGLLLARALAAAYEIKPRGHEPVASPHPAYLPAHDAGELRQIVAGHVGAVREADPSDTRAVLTACWYAVCVAECLAQFAANRDPRYSRPAAPRSRAGTVGVGSALESAPSLPADIHGVGLDTDPPAETPPELVPIAIDGARLLADAVAVSLERAAGLAQDPKDRAAAAKASRAALDLASLRPQHRA